MWVTVPVKLTNKEMDAFSEFYWANQHYLRHGDYQSNDKVDQLKPFIDKNWEKYQAWKEGMEL